MYYCIVNTDKQNLAVMKIYRKHNASSLFSAWVKKIKGWGDDVIYTWTQIESKAEIFETEDEAKKVLEQLMSESTNNYSFQYSII